MITLIQPLTVSGNVKLTDDIYWSRNTGTAIVAVGPATIDLNGHRIIGVGGKDNASVGVGANNQSNITVMNGTIQGFSIGVKIVNSVARDIESYSQTDNKILNMTLRDCLTNGFILGGKDCTVDNTQIFNIGLEGIDTSRAFGGQFFGPNATLSNSRVSLLYGGSESVGVSFSGRMQNNSSIINSVLDGRVASGQSFAVWSSDAVPFTVVGSSLSNWDYAFGGPNKVNYSRSTFADNGTTFGNLPDGATDILGGLSTITPHLTYSSHDDVIIGDASGGRYKAGMGNDFIAGMEGHDHLFGNEGSDTFAYITPPSILDKDVIMDLMVVSNDRMGFAREIYGAAADANGKPRLQFGKEAVGNQATFLEDTTSYTIYFDQDGAGGAPKIPIAYVPYMILTQDNLIFLDSPADSKAFKKFAPSWGVQAVGDFNNDGAADLLWQYSPGGNLSEWLMFDGLRAAPFGLPTMPGARVIAAADLNGDGTTDLLWRNSVDNVTSWLMKGGRFVTNVNYGKVPGWELAASGDFNGDGTDDLLWQSPTGSLSEWLLFNGVRYASNSNLPSLPGSKATAGDFDGDGTTDLMWQQANDTNFVWIMDKGQRSATLFLPMIRDWTNLAAGDFNGDGTDDLLWRHNTSGALIVWDMQNGRQGDTRYFGQSAGLEFLGVGDVNHDGKDDLLWRHIASTDIRAWLL